MAHEIEMGAGGWILGDRSQSRGRNIAVMMKDYLGLPESNIVS